MRKSFLILVAVTCLLSSAAAAQLMNSFYFIPVVTKAQGLNGTFWQSDVAITNFSSTNATIGAKYFPSDVANSFNGAFPVTITVPAWRTVLITDFVGTKFPSAGLGKGFAILADVTPVNCGGSSPPTAYPGVFAITSRTYNTGDPKGTYSTAAEMNLAGANFTTFPSVIPGVRHTGTTAPGFRTNLSVANLSTARIRVLISIYDSFGGTVIPASVQDIESLSFKQWSLQSLGVTSINGGVGHIDVRLADGQVADPCAGVKDAFCSNPCDDQKCPQKYAMRSQPTFYAYASTTDNGTGDGTILSPFIDWQGYNKWVSAYEDQHCPSLKITLNNTLTDWLRSQGLVGPEPPPTFRKVDR
jgi:hypothetical protein